MSELCHCIGPSITCWACSNGRHDECTANQHGDPDAKCPTTTDDVVTEIRVKHAPEDTSGW